MTKRTQILQGEAAQIAEPPYLLESVEFRRYVQQKVVEAHRLRDDLESECEHLQAELDARRLRQADLDEIIARGEAALAIDLKPVPAPHLTTNAAVQAAIDKQRQTSLMQQQGYANQPTADDAFNQGVWLAGDQIIERTGK